MSAVDSLESLDNKALRAKCLEYGLPNVPITDTSRKILIKKLRSAIEGKPTTNAKSSRRETIHVVQQNTTTTTLQDANKKSNSTANNRRTTIANTREDTPTKLPGNPELISQRRRSSRSTPGPVETKNSINNTTPVKRKPPQTMIIEEDGFDEDFILIDDEEVLPQKSPPKKIIQIPVARSSRSPSLTKSVTVTTSYGKGGAVPKTIHENESENNDFYYDKQSLPSKIPQHQPMKYDPPRAYNLTTTTNRAIDEQYSTRYGQPKVMLQNMSTEKVNFPTNYKSIYPNLNAAIDEVSPPIYPNDRKTTTTTTTTRRYTTSGYQQQPQTSQQTYRSSTGRNYIENSDQDADDLSSEEQAPYLSDFARRLTNLKAEPLDAKFKEDFIQRHGGSFYESGSHGRRSYSKKSNTTLFESFKDFLYALEYKYKLRRNLFILCLLSVIILALYYYYNTLQ